ncbi:MAG: S-layer homology domain-containing protein, partial [Clostridia bacterium]|nr:S-layer homology domain-containing protein [Clostridia bacterium]
MKKLVSLILTAIMIASVTAFSVSAAGSPYIDVKESRWSCDAIVYASEKGYMDGVGGGKFDPAAPMTRAMVVTVLYRREGEPAVTFKDKFSDVKDGKWYSKAVVWASNRGIVNGVSEGIFDPNGKITREQLVTMLHRYCDVKLLDVSKRADLGVFADKNKIHGYAAESFAWAVGEGLISGMTKDTAAPRGNATREQFAMILKRFDDAPFVLKERGSVTEKYCTVEYIIKYPEGYDHTEKRPLLVFLHGSGSSGTGLDEL